MGIFDFFKEATKRHLDKYDHEDNLAALLEAVPQRLAELGVDEETEMELEYFFTTNRPENADHLVENLTPLGYTPEKGTSPEDDKIFTLKGKSKPIKMAKDKVCQWVRDMCILGFEEDCKFENWKSNESSSSS